MTPSEKPERSETQPDEDANRTSVITHDDGATTAPAEHGAEETGTSAGDNGESPEGAEAPPPWKRATTAPPDDGSESDAAEADAEPGTASIPKPSEEPDTLRMSTTGSSKKAGPSAVYGGSASARSGAATASSSSRRPNRGPRRASLRVKRVDPWSVLKLALVLSVALFFVWMIAVAVLYGVLDGMGVWDQLNGTFTELTQSGNSANESLISAGKVFSVASIIGGINIVLFTALATVAAFIYNVAADFAGGIELTLSERE